MNSIKKHKKNNYVQVANSFIRDNRISFKAKGLFAYMYSMDEDWNFTVRSIANQQKDGVDSIISAMNELKEYGYVRYEKRADGSGIYHLEDEPNTENPNMDFPNLGNSTPIKKEKLYKNINNKKKKEQKENSHHQTSSNTQNSTSSKNNDDDLDFEIVEEDENSSTQTLDTEKCSTKNIEVSSSIQDAIDVSAYLYLKIISYNPTFKGDASKWYRDIELAIRLDGRDKKSLMNCIDWIYSSSKGSFWIANVLSGKKLREKFDTMNTQAMTWTGTNGLGYDVDAFVEKLCGNNGGIK